MAPQAVYFETTAAGGVTWEEVEEAQLKGGAGGGGATEPRKKLSIKIPKWCGKWVVSMDEYKDGVVGAKSKNLAGVCHSSSAPHCCAHASHCPAFKEALHAVFGPGSAMRMILERRVPRARTCGKLPVQSLTQAAPCK